VPCRPLPGSCVTGEGLYRLQKKPLDTWHGWSRAILGRSLCGFRDCVRTGGSFEGRRKTNRVAGPEFSWSRRMGEAQDCILGYSQPFGTGPWCQILPRATSWATLSRPLRQAQGRLCGTEFWTAGSQADSNVPEIPLLYARRSLAVGPMGGAATIRCPDGSFFSSGLCQPNKGRLREAISRRQLRSQPRVSRLLR
jgi:hypothetical protein